MRASTEGEQRDDDEELGATARNHSESSGHGAGSGPFSLLLPDELQVPAEQELPHERQGHVDRREDAEDWAKESLSHRIKRHTSGRMSVKMLGFWSPSLASHRVTPKGKCPACRSCRQRWMYGHEPNQDHTTSRTHGRSPILSQNSYEFL